MNRKNFSSIFLFGVAVVSLVILVNIYQGAKNHNREFEKFEFLNGQASDSIKAEYAKGVITLDEAIKLSNEEITRELQNLSGQVATGFTQTGVSLSELKKMNNEVAQNLEETKSQIGELHLLLGQIDQTAGELKEAGRQMSQKQDGQFEELKKRTRTKVLGFIPVGK